MKAVFMNIEPFYNKIIRSMPKGLSQMDQARYVYISLGKLFSFDDNYYFGPSKLKNKIYTLALQNKVNFKSLSEQSKNKAICVSIARVYSDILNKIGIKSFVNQDDLDDPHMNTIFSIDNHNYQADLQKDLLYVQLHCRTHYFGKCLSCNDKSLSCSQLELIDSKIGFAYSGEKYIQEQFDLLKPRLQSISSLPAKVKMILDSATTVPNVDQLEFSERFNFCSWFLSKLLSTSEKMRIMKKTLYYDTDVHEGYSNRTNFMRRKYLLSFGIIPDPLKVKTSHFRNSSKNDILFMYSEKSNRFIITSQDKVDKYLDTLSKKHSSKDYEL